MIIIRKFLGSIGIIASVIFLCSCAMQEPNVALKRDFWNASSKRPVVVSIAKNPSVDLYKGGSQGLIDIAISSMATNTFSQYLQHYNLADFNSIKLDFIHDLQKHHIEARAYNDAIDIKKLSKVKMDSTNYATKDYRPFSIKVKSNQLLLINIDLVGAERQYYAMIPLGPPVALCSAKGQLIDLKNNKLLWRFSTAQTVKVDGEWDQPPYYPNFTNALKKSIYQAKQELIKNFFYAAH